jgi:predicted DNA-binding WGR domain protein
MSATKWVLLNTSDGDRGDSGKQKVYEVLITGTTVTFTWGMAEKTTRQTKVQTTWSEGAARQVALNQVQAKVAKGYRLAYSA